MTTVTPPIPITAISHQLETVGMRSSRVTRLTSIIVSASITPISRGILTKGALTGITKPTGWRGHSNKWMGVTVGATRTSIEIDTRIAAIATCTIGD
eukprot:CAMPEP_0201478430 /NCGR_PEP_ID=MMETSP0151_2-20130828/3267_1 /ASSEMBLY_ACC=CAM_ASM_000257 /TAXON_ID=200890 /ORGANISM="Paramoeba atlantica, Strain 621/1 / CCAP 1560/9" /LENGTH=96 /DNA_ID=CAMNT_0047859497 /DNA_START=1002 /DNA_END=1292 /DNA_ORIENTATION=+